MNKYINYFIYIIKHKYYVFLECFKMGLILHAFTHDLSKFMPSEFIPYAIKFYGNKPITEEIKINFEIAWLLHQHRNKHHWDFWINSQGIAITMPKKYIMHMIADWRGMSRVFGDTAKDFYEKNKIKMNLHTKTIELIYEELMP